MVLMSSPASSSKRRRKSNSCNASRDRMIVVFALAVAVLPWIVWDKEEKHVTPIVTELRSDNDSAVVILTVIDAEHTVVASEISDSSKDDAGLRSQLAVSCPNDRGQISLSLLELTSPALNLAPLLALPQRGQEMLDTMGAALASIGTGGIDFITYARRKIAPNFAASIAIL